MELKEDINRKTFLEMLGAERKCVVTTGCGNQHSRIMLQGGERECWRVGEKEERAEQTVGTLVYYCTCCDSEHLK